MSSKQFIALIQKQMLTYILYPDVYLLCFPWSYCPLIDTRLLIDIVENLINRHMEVHIRKNFPMME